MKSRNVVIISHKNLPQPDDELVLHLNQKEVDNVVHITHAFSDSPTRISNCKWYRNGSKHKEWETRDYKKYPEPIIYIKEFIFTLYCVFKTKLKFDTAVCMDGMCTFFGIFLRSLG
ncbi:hypothetical protein K0B04_04425, partial [Patescibacteria group bacterium]|nr:hypothetical protein [Patescibacteria group bacterium]